MTPQLIKPALAKGLIEIMEPILAEFQASKEWQAITERAYPPPPAPIKKKKEKNKGTMHPGAAKAKAQAQQEAAPTTDGVPAATAEVPIR